MSTETAPTTPASTTPAPKASTSIAITIIDQLQREEFDAIFRGLTHVPTPMPPVSEAFHAQSSEGNTLGVGYLTVHHVIEPYALAVEAPPETMTRITEAMTDHLRSTVRDSIAAAQREGRDLGDVTADRGLSYDVYVPPGQPGPEGFERLPVEVWRRRVC